MSQIVLGDCLTEIDKINQVINCVVTSPPYAEQRQLQYGGIAPEKYPDWTVQWMEAVKPKLAANGSVAIIIRPHLHQGQISDYVLKTRLAVREAGWRECDELIWIKPNSPPMGNNRRPRRSWESILWFSLCQQPYCDPKANGQISDRIGMKGKKGKTEGYISGMTPSEDWVPTVGISRCRDYIEVGTSEVDYSEENTHPAQYPVRLAAWLVRLFCPADGWVLDPFIGSGTTALACLQEKRNYLGIEINENYFQIASNRIKNAGG